MMSPTPFKPAFSAPLFERPQAASEDGPQDAQDAPEGPSGPRGAIGDAAALKRFLLAGNAVVTFQSRRTGTHFTYRVRTKRGDSPAAGIHSVSLLTGPNNRQDYEYLGTIFGGSRFVHGRKSRILVDAPGCKAFAWVWSRIASGAMPAELEVYHEGRCGRCGRALTTPESITLGIGPECLKKMEGR